MKNSRIFKFILLVILIFVMGFVVREFGLEEYFSAMEVQDRVSEFGVWAPIAFIAIFALVAIVFLPVTPLDFVAGAIFGTFWGVVYVVIGATIGATVAFFFTRTLGRSFVQKQIAGRFTTLNRYDKKMEKHGLRIMFFLRLVPLFPFNGLNFAMGLTSIKFKDYFVATLFGIIPGAFAYVYFGNSLANASIANIFIATTFLILLSSVYPIYNKFRKKEKNEFDIIVIGAGSGGLNIASFMNKAGLKTLLIDKDNKSVGGDCLNFGCIPSKALIHVARTIKTSNDAEKYGVKTSDLPDMQKIKKYIKKVQDKIRKHENAEYFKKQGMQIELGVAKFVSKNEVEVGGKKFKGHKIVISTGSRPRKLEVPGIEKVEVYTNETIFNIQKLPKKLLVVGGGPIGVELGQAFRHLGSEVEIVHRGGKGLGKERADISEILARQLKKDGVRFHYNSEIEEFVSADKAVLKNSKNDSKKEVFFDAVLVAIGRQLNTEGLGLKMAGVKTENGKIKTNEYLQTTNKSILLAGDVAGSLMFTHAAELHASIILNNFFSPFKKKLSYDKFSWVTFTYPEVATFGIGEDELKKRGVKYTVLEKDFKDDDRALTDDYPDSLVVLYVGKDNKLLGGSIVAPRAGELAQELILAISAGLKIDQIFAKIYPYPTATRINKSLVGSLFAKKLSSKFNRKLLRIFYH